MKNIGIITIHKIFNYGSIFQTYALQEVCKNMGNKVEIIDYSFPNEWHRNRSAGDYIKEKSNILFTHRRSYWKEILLKLFFSYIHFG